jgi:hypothetical protein
MILLFAILIALASEITFAITYIVAYFIFLLISLLYTVVFRNPLPFHYFFSGFICGITSAYFSGFVAFFISYKVGFTESSALILALILPVIGEFAYFEYRFRLKKGIPRKVSLFGRIQFAMRTFPQRREFEYSKQLYKDVYKGAIRLGVDPGFQEDSIGQKAYDYAQAYLKNMFLSGLLGIAIGTYLVYFTFHAQ